MASVFVLLVLRQALLAIGYTHRQRTEYLLVFRSEITKPTKI